MEVTTVSLDAKTRKQLALMKIKGDFCNYDALLNYLIKKNKECGVTL